MTVDDVIKCFFKIFYPNSNVNTNILRKVYDQANMLYDNGWTYQQICNRLVSYYKDNPENKISNLLQIESFKDTPPYKKENNLLDYKFYYHKELQRRSEPNEIEVTIDGEIKKKRYPYYLEMVDMYTTDDLLNYFKKSMGKTDSDMRDKDNKKSLYYLQKNYSLDIALFSIDHAKNVLKEKNYRMYSNAKRILDHVDDGIELLNDVKDVSPGEIVPYYKTFIKKNIPEKEVV